MNLPTHFKQWYFYCAECEQKTKAILYFRTWCPCHESSVIATFDYIDYSGMAVDQESWEAMDAKPTKPVIGLLNFDLLRQHK